jgi:hypothetical protein
MLIMAIEETKCTENYFIPRGPQGPRGITGAEGPAGPSGSGVVGPQGPAGGSKIDINFQVGKDPYIFLEPQGQYKTLGHFIFPGTVSFTPLTWRVAISTRALSQGNQINIKLVYYSPDGTKSTIASVNDSVIANSNQQGLEYKILETDNFTALPTGAANFAVEARALFVDEDNGINGTHVTLLYATELRS